MLPRVPCNCLILGWLIPLSTALFFDSQGVVRPINPYVFIGDTLNLTCHVTDNDRFPGNVSELLYFTKMFGTEEKPIPEEYVTILDTRSILLEYPVTSGDDQGGYSCHLNSTTGEAAYINSQRVTVEYRPVAVQSLNYLVYDWRNMTVTWDLGQKYVNLERVKVQLVWTIDGTGVYNCPHQTQTSCTWKERDERDTFMNMPYFINVNVTTLTDEQSPEETAHSETGWIYINTQLHVKPAPVENLRVVDRNSTCISVSWQQTQKAMGGLVHTVLVTKTMAVQRNVSTAETRVTICDLQPATEYVVSVSCIPVPIGEEEPKGYYSDWRDVQSVTHEDVPSGAPNLAPGSFLYHPCESPLCDVTVYWQPITKEESNGQITRYRLKLTDVRSEEQQEYYVVGSERSVDIKVKKDRDYAAQLTARTSVGYSKSAASIRIPSLESKPPYPSHFLVERQGLRLYISWSPDLGDTPTGYTLYYCNGLKTTSKCVADDIHWKHLPANQTSYELLVSDDNIDNMLIGISTETGRSTETGSSGIFWSMCTYARDMDPPKLDVSFSPEQPDRALRVEWERPECSWNTPYIRHYLVTYCRGNQNRCTGSPVNKTFPSSEQRLQSHVIKDLAVGVMYRVTLKAASRSGLGPESDPQSKEVTFNGLSSSEISGIAFGGVFLFILLLAVGVFTIRRLHKNVKNMKYKIDLPREVREQNYERPGPPSLPDRNSPYTELNNNNVPSSSHALDIKGHTDTQEDDADNSKNLTSDQVDSISSSTNSSSDGSATSTTLLVPNSQLKHKAPNLVVKLPVIASSSTETSDPGYKSYEDLMKNDSSGTGNTAGSYSKMTSGYTPSPVSSPESQMSDSSQLQLIPEDTPSPTEYNQMHEGYVTLPENPGGHVMSKQTPNDHRTVQNSDYVRYG